MQIRHDRDQRGFAEQLFAECEEHFFENSDLDELFLRGRAHSLVLGGRLQWLCKRLSFEITQESLFFDPQRALEWVNRQGRHSLSVSGRLEAAVESREQAV